MLFPYGNNIKLYIEGGSHDEKIEMLLKGFPEGLKIDEEFLSAFMKRRAPGQNEWSTKRKEADKPVFLSGIKDGVTTGEDIHAVIFNSNQHSSDYSDMGKIPRPSHADYPAIMKYGKNVDLRGGGHFSGRLTSLMCIAGALAIQYLREKGISVFAHIYSVGSINDTPFSLTVREEELKNKIPSDFPVLSPDKGDKMKDIINQAKAQADSVGGIIECAVTGLPVGLGEHMFGSVEAGISSIMFAVPAVKGIEFGNGFGCSRLRGSENNDPYYYDENGVLLTKTNNQGGISGGMTNGMPVVFRVAVKPTPSIGKEQSTVDLEEKTNIKYTVKGRHDPCIVPRAVPVIEAAAAISILDMMLGKE